MLLLTKWSSRLCGAATRACIGWADTSPFISFTVNNPLGYLSAGATLNFNAGDTIYFNVRNYFKTTPTCPYSSCDVLFDFATPNRY